jgi:16S rRNA (cytosine1402-N4)-methyltransferase
MLDEVIGALMIKSSGVYIDATFGRGGHSLAIVERLGDGGRLLALDRDPQAVEQAHRLFHGDSRVEVVHGAFSDLKPHTVRLGWTGRVDGILLDLGVSSPQLDDPSRGFSFRSDGPLDMRMNTHAGISAAQWLASASEQEIARVLDEYGEERYARRIARGICAARELEPIATTGQLACLIAELVPSRERHKDPATRSFQAIRICVNDELRQLSECLDSAVRVLAPGGRLVVISFHSLEDRIVKRFMRDEEMGPELPRKLPVRHAQDVAGRLRRVGKAQKPREVEVEGNPRARSAVLRVAERTECM